MQECNFSAFIKMSLNSTVLPKKGSGELMCVVSATITFLYLIFRYQPKVTYFLTLLKKYFLIKFVCNTELCYESKAQSSNKVQMLSRKYLLSVTGNFSEKICSLQSYMFHPEND